MPLILPHKPIIQQHANLRYLWRIRCLGCKFEAITSSHGNALEVGRIHAESEDPFPDLELPETPGGYDDR